MGQFSVEKPVAPGSVLSGNQRAEAMDRLSRDQEDIAGLFKRMAFGGVRIVTLS